MLEPPNSSTALRYSSKMNRYYITLLTPLSKGLSREKHLPSLRVLSHPSSSHQDFKHRNGQGPSDK